MLRRTKQAIIRVDKRLDARPKWVMMITLALCALLAILKKPEAFTHAQFWAEDGFIWFGQAYNQGFWHTIALPYSGTFSILTRLVGYVATLLPLNYAPLFFSVTALAFQLLPVFIINSSRLKHVVHYRLVAILVSIIYICAPNSMEVFVNLANIQWHLGIAAFLVLIASKPTRRRWAVFDVLVLGLTGLTGPLGLMLAPIAFLIWYKQRDRPALVNLVILIATSLCQALSLLIIQPAQRGGHLDLSLVNAIKMVVGQIFTGGLFGEHYVTYFYDNFLLYVVLALGLLIILYAIRKGPSWLAYANLYALFIFVCAIFSLTPLKGTNLWEILTHVNTGQRYWYIPIFVWLMTLLWVALAAKNVFMRVSCGCLILGLFLVGIPGSWSIKPLPDKHYQYYVHKFNAQPDGRFVKIPINPDGWSMNLKKH